MSTIVEECAHHCLLPDGQSTLYDALPPFDEELSGDVTAEELSLPPPLEAIDENPLGQGSSLPATPAERPCTFCPSSLPLPPASCPSRATLVLDLDGTLIASEELNAANSTYLWSPHASARTPDYEAMGRRVWLRPGVREFLFTVRSHFEIVLFTAATQNWAAAAIEQLDPAAELFDVMLHRDHTTSDMMWDYVKDLSRLGRDLARVVIVDDNPLMFMYQPDNALHVGAYEASLAGGPDNVLERVAELLVGQVATAEDVREILGPMASVKTCITSTVSASTAAAPCSIAAAAPCDQQSAAASGILPATTCAGADGPCFVPAEGADAISSAAGGCEDGPHGVGSSEATMAEDYQHQDHPQSEQGLEHLHLQKQEATQSCPGSASGYPAAAPAETETSWDTDSDGAETFDASGAAARLGADVGECSYRHRDWQQFGAHAHDVATTAAGQAGAAPGEGGELGEGDAARGEEHNSEDFEALMEDAIAEYDSDAYEERYDKELGCDNGCPADTATTVMAPHADSFGCLSSGSFTEGSDSSQHRWRAKLCPYEGSYADAGHREDSLGEPAPFNLYQTGCELDLEVDDAAAGRATGGPVSMGTTIAADAAPLATKAGPAAAVDAPPLEPRQSSLPTGMVFLTDLNPALGPGCPAAAESGDLPAGADFEHGTGEAWQAATASPQDATRNSTRSVLCKRPREQVGVDTSLDASSTGQQEGGGPGAVAGEGMERPCYRVRLGSEQQVEGMALPAGMCVGASSCGVMQPKAQ